MSTSNKYNHFENYLLKGKLRRNGFEKWRYVFTGIDKSTGEQRPFFVELYYVNPLISPKSPILSQKSRPKMNASDLQYALAGTLSAQTVSQELKVQPSYVLVKAGMYGSNGKQLNRFSAASSLVFSKNDGNFKVNDCIFGNDLIAGSITVSPKDIREQPELLCSTGIMDWNLHFDRSIKAGPETNTKTNLWMPSGARTVFAGLVHIDGKEFTVVPRSSSGYIDKSWGTELPNPFFHISSSNLVSMISGKPLTKSCFAVEGEYDKTLSIYLMLEGEKIDLNTQAFFNKAVEIHNWSQMPQDADGEKLHWTVSVHRKKLVIDMDIYCKTEEMFVRDYEIPGGGRKLLKTLGGGTGFGELRIYKKAGQNLEMMEHANVLDAVCEYGTVDENEE